MNKSKILYSIAGILLIVAAVLIATRIHKSPSTQTATSNNSGQVQQPDQTQIAQNSTPTNSTTTAEAGCPKGGEDLMPSTSANRYKPTINLNKTVTLHTNLGDIKLAFYGSDAPKTVENFVCLAEKGYYNNTTFHRIVPGFVIQGGDPTGTGSGGTSIYGDKFEDELYSDTKSYQQGYTAGTLAMANSGPNTNGSQFFIMLANTQLPHDYTIFGHVISGMDIVQKIAAVPTDPIDQNNPGMGGKPKSPVTIESVTVEEVK